MYNQLKNSFTTLLLLSPLLSFTSRPSSPSLLSFLSPSFFLCFLPLLRFFSASFLSSSSCPATCPAGCRWRQWEEQEVQSTSHFASIATSHSKL